MIRALYAVVVASVLAIYLALMDGHRPLPAGLVYRGGRVLLGESRNAS